MNDKQILTQQEMVLGAALRMMGINLTNEEVMTVQAIVMNPHLEDMTVHGGVILKKSIHEAYLKRLKQCK